MKETVSEEKEKFLIQVEQYNGFPIVKLIADFKYRV